MANKETRVEKIVWEDYFRVDFKQIDVQHESFVDLVNRIIDNIESEHEILEGLCHELIAFAKYHFLSEENLMIKSRYPEYTKHKKHHNLLMAKLNENIVGVQLDQSNVSELIAFLHEWFSQHTNTDDKALAKHLDSIRQDRQVLP